MEGTPPATVPQDSSAMNVYHIYHTGKDDLSYSIHSISDSNAVLKLDAEAAAHQDDAKNESDAKDSQELEKPVVRRQSTLSRMATKMKRAKSYDDPRYDPRTESSPYFVHLPKVAFRLPPYTLRHGGMKTAPAVALMHPACGWRAWKLEFGDVLSQPGVIDRRGVVSLNHGTLKGENGTLKGYALRSSRMRGESGKAWFNEQKALGEQPVQSSTNAKPEEVVDLKWVSPFSFRTREYHFSWRGYDFVWKGTGKTKAKAKSIFRPLLRFNHLKLVVLVPLEGENEATREVILATYTSVVSARKMGRLELDQEAMDAFLAENILHANGDDVQVPSGCDKNSLQNCSPSRDTTERTQQRMKDVVVATGMSMIIGEFQKRQVLIGLLLTIIENGGG